MHGCRHMRTERLRRTLLDLILAVTPLAASGCGLFSDDDPCVKYGTHEVRVAEPPPAELEMVLRACEADQAKCLEFCTAALTAEWGLGISAVDCQVEHDATGHDLAIGFYAATGASGCPVDGRRPAGLRRAQRPRAGAVGTHLARSAWFEAASVHAFVHLARELARHGAPSELTRDAQCAAVDEIRHARTMGALARARGATPPVPEVAAPRRRSIESIATENAVEGLVGETWAALMATWQAAHAPAAIRDTFARIAIDETGHAALARRVDAWARTRLTKAACRRVDAARRRAVSQLEPSRGTTRPILVRELGLPNAAAAQRLFEQARSVLWS